MLIKLLPYEVLQCNILFQSKSFAGALCSSVPVETVDANGPGLCQHSSHRQTGPTVKINGAHVCRQQGLIHQKPWKIITAIFVVRWSCCIVYQVLLCVV